MRPGEAVAIYLYNLKRLFQQAMLELAENTRQPLLLHHFLSGLPDAISRQPCVSGDMKDLNTVVQRAKTLMTVMEQGQAAALTTAPTPPSEVDQLKTQITQLTEQVAALTVKQSSNKRFYCNQLGHTQHSFPTRFINQRCYRCNRPGHYVRDCWQGNDQGISARGHRHPSHQ